MLGRSSANNDHYHDRDRYYQGSNGYQGSPGTTVVNVNSGTNPAQPVQVGPTQDSGGSWGMAILRFVLWMLILSVIGWAIWRIFFRNKAATKPESHYSLK